jgi:hypothetical protein
MENQVRIGRYVYKKSTRKDKKLMTEVNGKKIHFGAKDMEHYMDRTGLLSPAYNHYDDDRRDRYLKRAKGIRDKNGNLTWTNPMSANHHALHILWM